MKEYRADIDGLRAIAVLFVLFFHLDIALFASGFVGVDVFFTISGFLITGIVLKENETGSFSFKRFYVRRAFRLLPAYVFLVLIVLVVGVGLLTPIAFSKLIQSSIASSLFLSNIYFFLTQGGYFSTAVSELPMLHTWSLSVEEQFYLFMPFLLVLWLKFCSKKFQLIILLLFLILSILVSYFLTDYHQKLAYFIVFSRAHEFLLGSVLAVSIFRYGEIIKPKTVAANTIFFISLIVLFISAMVITDKKSFPGLFALIPCLATSGIIYSGYNIRCLSHKILGFKWLVFIGLLSYSLYLWHWPIIAFIKFSGLDLSPTLQFGAAFAAFLGAYISWRFVEKKIRYMRWNRPMLVASSLYLVPSIVLITFYFHAMSNDFYSYRFSDKIVAIEKSVKSTPESGRTSCHTSSLIIDNKNCILGEKEAYTSKSVLWGDSHANHFVGFMDEYGKSNKMRVQDITMGNCPPIPGLYINAHGAKESCKLKNEAVLKYVLSNPPDNIFLAASWGGYLLGENIKEDEGITKVATLAQPLIAVIDKLLNKNIDVFIFKMIPRMPKDLSLCYLKVNVFPQINDIDDCAFEIQGEFLEDLSSVYSELGNYFGDKVHFISVSELFCKDLLCNSYIDETPLYRDTNHLNLDGSRALGKAFSRTHIIY
jgi:peptidoglycan/LPS O-acetylase OafA/YrhL